MSPSPTACLVPHEHQSGEGTAWLPLLCANATMLIEHSIATTGIISDFFILIPPKIHLILPSRDRCNGADREGVFNAVGIGISDLAGSDCHMWRDGITSAFLRPPAPSPCSFMCDNALYHTMTHRPSKHPLPSESTKRDIGTAAAKGLLSLIPVAGGPAAELFGLLNIPLAHRRDAWFQDLALRLGELEGQIKGFSLDNLADNEQFVSATLQATQAVLRTHQKEKLEALRNAVLNCALKKEPQDDYQTVFLSLIDRFTPAHLRLLKSFRNPALTPHHPDYIRWLLAAAPQTSLLHGVQIPKRRKLPRWVRDFSPGFSDASQEFILVLLSDLHGAGLIVTEPGSSDDLPDAQKWTTTFGEHFLNFIETPQETS